MISNTNISLHGAIGAGLYTTDEFWYTSDDMNSEGALTIHTVTGTSNLPIKALFYLTIFFSEMQAL